MHGLVNAAFQTFISTTFSHGVWQEVVSVADLPFESFEAMQEYEDIYSLLCLHAVSRIVDRPPVMLLEDFGTFLVTHQPFEQLRRLLRFGGGTYLEFLYSLEGLNERGRLVLPELCLPRISVEQPDEERVELHVRCRMDGSAHVLHGLLRAMADDYGTLASLDVRTVGIGHKIVSLELHDIAFSEGKRFSLAEALTGAAPALAEGATP